MVHIEPVRLRLFDVDGSVLGPILFLIYCADVTAIALRHRMGVHSYADDTQLYFHYMYNQEILEDNAYRS